MQDTVGEVRMNDVLLWTPSHGRASVGRPARTYIQQDVVWKTCRNRWMTERNDEIQENLCLWHDKTMRDEFCDRSRGLRFQ